jgi:hypothetical protein
VVVVEGICTTAVFAGVPTAAEGTATVVEGGAYTTLGAGCSVSTFGSSRA